MALFGLILAITPTTLFFFGSVNPSALEIAAGIALWAAGGMLVLEAPSRIDRRLVALTGVSATLLMLSRSLSPLWVSLIAVTLAVFAPAGALRRLAHDPACRIWGAVVAVATVAQAAWIVTFDALGKQGGQGVHGSSSELLRVGFGKSTVNYEQMIGVFGWLDTPAPFLTFLLWTILLGGLTGLALVVGRPAPVSRTHRAAWSRHPCPTGDRIGEGPRNGVHMARSVHIAVGCRGTDTRWTHGGHWQTT